MNGDGLGWLTDRQRDGGIDEIPLPGGSPGTLHLCGKRAAARIVAHTPWPSTVVCLTERHELVDRYPDYVRWLDDADDDRAIWFPMPDLGVPSIERMAPFVDELVDRLGRGDALLVHCGAGMGRAGTTAVGVLVRLGADVATACETVAAARPGAGPEVGAQLALVRELAAPTR